MRAIVIGAGRGQRLMPTTAHAPKCFAEVAGRRILDWIVEAFARNGVDDIVFVGGYLIEQVQADYPEFTFVHNGGWAANNILASLMCAEDLMDRPFFTTYADILYRPHAVRALQEASGDIRCVVDTKWRERYEHRTEHPMTDGEKVTVADGRLSRIHRDIDPDLAHGEFTGVARFSVEGARALREHYHRCRGESSGRAFREAPSFEKAYLIHLLQEMIEHGVAMDHVDVPGEYWEIDTQQDFDMARADWRADP
jgi:L-glutamine-phosphate cytidylyltransferase